MRIMGIVLIVIGALMLAYQGITYKTEETVVDLGPLEVQTQEEKRIPLPPILGGLTLAGGVALLVASSGKRHAA